MKKGQEALLHPSQANMQSLQQVVEVQTRSKRAATSLTNIQCFQNIANRSRESSVATGAIQPASKSAASPASWDQGPRSTLAASFSLASLFSHISQHWKTMQNCCKRIPSLLKKRKCKHSTGSAMQRIGNSR